MFKKILLVVFIILIVNLITTIYPKPGNNQNSTIAPTTSQAITKSQNTIIIPSKTSVFVPSWANMSTLKQDQEYDRYIYFGFKPGQNSTANLERFIEYAPLNKSQWLTIIMTDTDENLKVLKDPKAAVKIGQEAAVTAKKYGFEGIVLDLEMSVISFDDTVDEINSFVRIFSKEIKKANLSVGIALYGDVFYRKRPYDVRLISENVDEMMIMAYDFHKSRGEAGPNFPLSGKDKYGYDFQTMISDYLKAVPSEKLTVIFGMYGYDWAVDEKKRPLTQARSLTLNQIKEQFLRKCQWQDCVVHRDEISGETEVNYVKSEIKDDFANLYYHIVWFEDEESVTAKTKYLKSKSIGSSAFWAWSYF